MRLPTRTARALAVAALLLPNLANVYARDVSPGAGMEVPYDRMIADVWAARDPAGPTRTFVNVGQFRSRDDTFSDRTPGAVYYACVAERAKPSPRQFNGGEFWAAFRQQVGLAPPGTRVTARSTTTEVIVWDGPSNAPRTAAPSDDDVVRSLGPGWTRAEETNLRHRGQSFWSWMEKEWYRRRRYVKSS
jgi:hypothetical protein